MYATKSRLFTQTVLEIINKKNYKAILLHCLYKQTTKCTFKEQTFHTSDLKKIKKLFYYIAYTSKAIKWNTVDISLQITADIDIKHINVVLCHEACIKPYMFTDRLRS